MAKKTPPENYVRGETNTLRLAALGHAINLRIYRKNSVVGRLRVGKGGLAWIPRGMTAAQARRVPWAVFAKMMKEWPFGHPKRARVKFADGAVRWVSPGKKGPGKRISWDEFVYRMEMPVTAAQIKAGLPKAVSRGKKKAPAKRSSKRRGSARRAAR